MTKPELISLISKKAQIPKKSAGAVLETLIDAIHDSLKDNQGKIRISDLGTFKVIQVAARKGVNPRTGKDMIIPAMKLARFYPAKSLREAIKATETPT
jgi:DNA-binding protein HU-beta